MPAPKPPYAAQFREQMVEPVLAGRKPGELVKGFGCHATSILNWVRQSDAAKGSAPANPAALGVGGRQELMDLRRKLRRVQMERDILAKATAWFAINGDKTFTPPTR
jgi:transposase